jgi:3,4-dihydroxy-2-butanone 4-phosphate synthase
MAARLPQLTAFAAHHRLATITMGELIAFRRLHQPHVQAGATVPG